MIDSRDLVRIAPPPNLASDDITRSIVLVLATYWDAVDETERSAIFVTVTS